MRTPTAEASTEDPTADTPDAADADAVTEEQLATAGLRYTSDVTPGIRRRRRGRGFSYTRPDGRPVVDPPTAARIRRLAIPPAWTDVWICTDPLGHLQATGRDDRGRKQYRYHDRWRAVREAHKFEQLASFGANLAELRRRVDADLSLAGLPRERVLALAVRLLDETLIRVGNREYCEANETFGLTTLRNDHVDLAGDRFVLDFVGKSARQHTVEVQDRRLSRVVRRCHELGGQHLFTYRDDDGAPHPITSADVNDYLRTITGAGTTAKEFRTWGGTVLVVEVLGPSDPPPDARAGDAAILEAIDRAADHLGNTRAVCRASYVHPVVLDAFRSGALEAHWRSSRATTTMRRGERATLALLEAPGSPVNAGGGRSARR